MKIVQLDDTQKHAALDLIAGLDEQSARIRSFLKERIGSYEVKGAYIDDALCGFIIYDAEAAQIVYLNVSEQHRNQGIGSALIDEVRNEASAHHYPRIKVNAAGEMIGFYESYGFEKTDEEKESGNTKVVPMEYLLGRQYIGKTVTVTVDRPYGSFHPHHPDVIYPLNYGYVDELISDDGEFQDAYVYGPKEPVETFRGIVSCIIYHKDGPSRFVVTRPGEMIDREAVMNAVAFEEQYYDTRFIWDHELN